MLAINDNKICVHCHKNEGNGCEYPVCHECKIKYHATDKDFAFKFMNKNLNYLDELKRHVSKKKYNKLIREIIRLLKK